MLELEKKVIQKLKSQKSDYINLKLGAAVSGGADSICLLMALSEIMAASNNPINVITINHNIRPVEETAGDAAFVMEFCKQLRELGKNITCKVVELPRGLVWEIAGERQGGIEEAARYLRYKAFDDFILENNLDYLCLAHNQNDQLETMLMRFFNGSSVEALAGIKIKRDKFLRPLIEVDRKSIEEYLTEKGCTWRTDSTNLQTEYERNKIRLELIPFLNEKFTGWNKALEASRLRYENDGDLLKALTDEVALQRTDRGISINKEEFKQLHHSIQYRVLIKAFNMAGETARVPHEFLLDFIQSAQQDWNNQFTKTFSSVEISLKKDCVLIKKSVNSNTDLVFFDIIEETGNYCFPFGKIRVFEAQTTEKVKVVIIKEGEEAFKEQLLFETALPFIVRSPRLDDQIMDSEGNNIKISGIFSDWHVSAEDRNLIPVFQQLNGANQNIECMAGKFLGYKDWIVKV